MRRFLIALILILLLTPAAWAANAVYTQLGTGVTWLNTAGDEELDLGGGDAEADEVLCGSYHDWGVDPRPTRYYIEVDIDGFATAPVVGETVDLYVSMGQTTSLWTGPEVLNNTADVAGATVRLKNLMFLGSAIVHTTTAGDNLVVSIAARITARYWAPCVHNNTADALLISADAHAITVYPVYPEVQ